MGELEGEHDNKQEMCGQEKAEDYRRGLGFHAIKSKCNKFIRTNKNMNCIHENATISILIIPLLLCNIRTVGSVPTS